MLGGSGAVAPVLSCSPIGQKHIGFCPTKYKERLLMNAKRMLAIRQRLANSQRRRISTADNVQDLGVPGVREKATELRKNAGSGRVLDPAGLRVHHAHIENGKRRDTKRCRFCRGGVQAVTYVPKEKARENNVVQSDGVDEEGAAPSPFSDEWMERIANQMRAP